ncbi:hypothetical protein [Salinigranum marinum]|uniref:DUF7855 family protein n=1 Tax=Salinigranum marinum TaxID=1515595 RepID=UPI002989A714|nr:hypothetical protein [Salinigranum marinum]
MLLVVTYSRAARTSLRNACRTHDETVVRRFGRAALLDDTHHGAFLALRLVEKHGTDVHVELTRPLNEFVDVPDAVREAARAYETRESPSTPYHAFVRGTDHPSPSTLREREL